MKKLFFFIPLLLLFPGVISAKVNVVRSFAHSSATTTTTTTVVIDVVAYDYDEDINCSGLSFWGIQAIEHETGNRFYGNPRFVSSEVLSQTFTLDLPAREYEELTFICSENGEDEAFQFGSIENNLADNQIIFTVQPSLVIDNVEEDAPSSVIDIIYSGAIPDDPSVSGTPRTDSAPMVPTPETDSTSSSQGTPAPVIQVDENGSTTLIAI